MELKKPVKKMPVLHDWEGIEREFRTGQLSILEIGRQYGVSDTAIRKHAQKYGWRRDLTDRVRKATRAALFHAGERDDASDDELVQEKADIAAAIIRQHRNDIACLRRVSALLSGRLEALVKGEAVEGISMGERESASDMLEKLTRSLVKVIQLERQAFNLNDTIAIENPLAAIFEAIDGARWSTPKS